MKQFLTYYKPYKFILFGVLVGSCVAAVMDLVFPAMVRQILNEAIPQQNMTAVWQWCGLLFALYLFNFGLTFATNYYGHIMSSSIENDMRRDLFVHLTSMSFRFFDNNKTGQLLSRMTSDITSASELTFRGVSDLLVSVISMVGSMAMMLYMNPILGGIICVLLAFKTMHTLFVNRRMKAAFKRNREKLGDVSAVTEETLSGIRVVKAFANEKLELNRFMAQSNDLYATNKESFAILSYFGGAMSFFTNATNLIVMAAGAYMITNDMLAFSDLIAFFLYVNLFMHPMMRLMMFTEIYQRGMAGFNRFQEMMSLPIEIEDKKEAVAEGAICGSITFDNVTFGYRDEQPVLKNFSLDIKPGEKVAFVGATGAGKTTIANLLLRFYEPQSGNILIDGINIKDYKQDFMHHQVGLVQQDVFLFSDSVKYNIAYGCPGASDEQIVQAAKLAAADEFVSRLPEGYDTKVGERGVKLSGGQKQRLAIARAFLKNPPIIVFDEATSALDTKTESQIQDALDSLAKNRTTLIIAHRLSTIVHADKIVVLQDGQIAEVGTHKELLAHMGIYKTLYELDDAA